MDITQLFSAFNSLSLHALSGDVFVMAVILTCMVVLFMTGKLRYDLVSMLAFLAVIIVGFVSPEEAFYGFAHPAVIIVASMFIVSKALIDSGIIEAVIRRISSRTLEQKPVLQLAILSTLVVIASAFINNIGALAFIMPIAIKMARKADVSPAMFLMPLAFASHIGGFLTLVGSPRNIIVSTFREEAIGESFAFFDFAYVGIGIAVVAVLFLVLVGWRLIPKRKDSSDVGAPFEIENYITEVEIGPDAKVLGDTIKTLRDSIDAQVEVNMLIRSGHKTFHPSNYTVLQEDDVLLIQDNAEALTELVEENGLTLVGNRAVERPRDEDDDMMDIEAVVGADSALVGRTWKGVSLRKRFGVNLLAISRHGIQLKDHLDSIRFRAGDVVLLRGRRESIERTDQSMGLLPLAERELQFGRNPKTIAVVAIFIITVIMASINVVPVHMVFVTAAVLMVLFNLVSLSDAYESISWPVIILLGAMITIGTALEASGSIMTISEWILTISQTISPLAVLALVLVISMLLSDFVNSTASAVLMAPVAIQVAQSIGASIDPFLMAVAIGASAAFLTPVAHESNTLVMSPGGYKFRDYWRMGLPLEILIAVTSIPLIVYFWPMF